MADPRRLILIASLLIASSGFSFFAKHLPITKLGDYAVGETTLTTDEDMWGYVFQGQISNPSSIPKELRFGINLYGPGKEGKEEVKLKIEFDPVGQKIEVKSASEKEKKVQDMKKNWKNYFTKNKGNFNIEIAALNKGDNFGNNLVSVTATVNGKKGWKGL